MDSKNHQFQLHQQQHQHHQQLVSGRYHFVSRPSLSTISEERTVATLSEHEEIEKQRSSQINFIETILNDIKTNSVFLNEMLCVFGPSSKGGNFNRNVPIRFTSPQKLHISKKDSENTPSTTTPETNTNELKNNKTSQITDHHPTKHQNSHTSDSFAKSSFFCSSTNSLNKTSSESFNTPNEVDFDLFAKIIIEIIIEMLKSC